MDRASFLSRNNVSEEEWSRAVISWEGLLAIYEDYCRRVRQLEDAAELVVKTIQSFQGVHSVRWRVKDPEHLLEKIIRKQAEGKPSKKYLSISVDNYHNVISDLIGVRALHLFKDDVFKIHQQVISMWGLAEKPVSYIREGDPEDLVSAFKGCGITPRVHRAGYRSVHYVMKTKPGVTEILFEVQVRTIFEEGWSEIDHRIRYPNFSDNKQIESILKIFNRLAGSADEMGGFIKTLSGELDSIESRVARADADRDNALDQIQQLVSRLATAEQLNAESAENISQLQSELDKVKAAVKESSKKNDNDNREYVTIRLNNGKLMKVPLPPGQRAPKPPPPPPKPSGM
ncbi:hypothetical protein [Pseudomonas sp. NBRC 111127]|uniref:hypothetical protein n=1 Tax=Pseudomonas sp. NBRC 111127 TaxID=1661042 RepID=UPI000A49E717|nr:hypothetical protein [Pseudomonas sp. NBRC 111127]